MTTCPWHRMVEYWCEQEIPSLLRDPVLEMQCRQWLAQQHHMNILIHLDPETQGHNNKVIWLVQATGECRETARTLEWNAGETQA